MQWTLIFRDAWMINKECESYPAELWNFFMGLHIKLTKSETIRIWAQDIRLHELTSILGCGVGSLPSSYSGLSYSWAMHRRACGIWWWRDLKEDCWHGNPNVYPFVVVLLWWRQPLWASLILCDFCVRLQMPSSDYQVVGREAKVPFSGKIEDVQAIRSGRSWVEISSSYESIVRHIFVFGLFHTIYRLHLIRMIII